jgi:hypothetical protein
LLFRAASWERAQTVNQLAERHQRCDKADAASRNDPKLEEISDSRSETMIFGDVRDCEVCMTG